LSVGRAGSRAAIDAAMATEDKTLVVVAPRDADQESPGLADVYQVGTLAVAAFVCCRRRRPSRTCAPQSFICRRPSARESRSRPCAGPCWMRPDG
jgi:hypothetical protein